MFDAMLRQRDCVHSLMIPIHVGERGDGVSFVFVECLVCTLCYSMLERKTCRRAHDSLLTNSLNPRSHR